MQDRLKAIGQQIRKRRKLLHLTQEQLGELSGLHPSYIGQIERGLRLPSVNSLTRIAEALDIPPNALLETPEKGRDGILRALDEVMSHAGPDEADLILKIAQLIVAQRNKR